MTQDQLAKSYLIKAIKRRRVLDVLLEEEAFSDVVSETQELVELALKAMLRHVGIDPPKWHDVGSILKEHSDLFPPSTQREIDELARISKWLRKERELSFYGDIDFIPTEEYSRADAERALGDAGVVVRAAEALIRGDEKPRGS